MGVGPSADTPVTEQRIKASFQTATRGYFQALRIPLRRGRLFDDRDQAPARSTLLSEGLARRLWPDGQRPHRASSSVRRQPALHRSRDSG